MKALLIYPHHLFEHHPGIRECNAVYLIEDPLFFSQYRFHKLKLILHRASMQSYREKLLSDGFKVIYVEFHELEATSSIALRLKTDGVKSVLFSELSDDWLSTRLKAALNEQLISFCEIPSPLFLNSRAEIASLTPTRSRGFYFHDFYIEQRRRRHLLIENGLPIGGKWSFDSENRSKIPKGLLIPPAYRAPELPATREATSYIETHFRSHPGSIEFPGYPLTHAQARENYADFLAHRLHLFGPYEDAIHSDDPFLFHSILSSSMNIGLLPVGEMIDPLLACSHAPLQSVEGFLRQIIGWREFIRGIYEVAGRKQRTKNFLQNSRSLPRSFYDGNTGILPVDTAINRVMKLGFCHHIERLMVLGNFMLLCDFHPDEVYRWFMELFIDSYDWVMVPNVYGMSQYADGGLMTTKPYISGSSYILKMSNYKKGPWCEIWDGLYWRFIDRHRSLIQRNPRLSVMAGMRDKLDASGKLKEHLKNAENFLSSL